MSLRSFVDARGETSLKADVVIVGSGPGGSAMAKALSEGGATVVMLEEGPSTPRFKPSMLHTNRYHMQENGVMLASVGGTQVMPIAAGRGVGGGSLVNSAIAFRTPARVLDGWADRLSGDDRFSRAHLDPVYEELEALLGVGMTSDEISGENNRIIARGAAKLGLPGGMAPRNTPGCVGCSMCNMGCPSGGKASVDRVLVPMARDHGAIVQGDVKVDEILIEGGRAVGVAGKVHDTDTMEIVGRLTVRADQVVVCAGGVGTPRLLHHTGVAKRLGDAVGRGLHVHPGNAVLGLCDDDVHMWKGATQGAYFEDPALPGVLPHTFNAAPGIALILMGGAGHSAKENLQLMRKLCGCVVMVSDEGEGRVGAKADGRADISYDFAPNDVERIKAGMVVTAKVLMAGGARKVLAMVHGVGWHTDVEAFAQALSTRTLADFGLYASHPMASCRMGSDPAAAVVDADGQAHGLPGLYVADSSVFPTSLGVNPQLTTMAVATVIGRRLAATA